jgi:hypothetical protein
MARDSPTLCRRFREGAFWGATMLCKTTLLRAEGDDVTTKIGGETHFVHRAVFLGPVRNHPEPLYVYHERAESLKHAPLTGFESVARQAYRAKTRRRYYLNLLRRWIGTLNEKSCRRNRMT